MVLEKRVESRLAEKNIDPDFHVKVKVNKKKQKQKEKWRGIMVYFKLSSFLSTLLQRGGGDKPPLADFAKCSKQRVLSGSQDCLTFKEQIKCPRVPLEKLGSETVSFNF